MSNNQKLLIWLNVTIFLLILMIMIGGITRLTDSGLSMVTWKPIIGVIPPISHQDWVHSFEEYKAFPEYNLKNINMSLSEYKTIFFWEYLHRMIGRFFGFLFVIPFTIFLVKGYLNKELIGKLIFLFVLGGMQGFVGWYMVKSGLVDKPDVSHYRLALHLFLAFIILSFTYKLKLSLLYKKIDKVKSYDFYNRFSTVIIILLFVQIIFGAFNAGLKTVDSVSTFPFYNGMLFPISKMSIDPFWLNFFENNFGVQIIHRYLAGLIVLITGYFVLNLSKDSKRIIFESKYLISLVLYQCILGVLTLVSNATLVFALFHQILAILLIMLMVRIKHKIKYI